jgi:Uma2 family endonuclease
MLAQRDVWPDRIRRLKRVEYDQLVDSGLLQDSRVELLLGVLVDMSPQGPRHAEVVSRIAERFTRDLTPAQRVRVQSPLALSDDSEPEPDVAVVPAGDYWSAHPSRALLVVEVAETSLLKDRGIKTALYATAGVPEFWLVNLAEQIIEVHRRPLAGRYDEVVRVDSTGTLTSEAFPNVRIMASEILR